MLSRDLTSQLNTAIQFLVHCRPLSVPQGNAIKFLKLQVRCLLPATSHWPADVVRLTRGNADNRARSNGSSTGKQRQTGAMPQRHFSILFMCNGLPSTCILISCTQP